MDGHEQQEVDLGEVREHLVDRRLRVAHEPDPDAEVAQLGEQGRGITELDVHDAPVRARGGEVGEEHAAGCRP